MLTVPGPNPQLDGISLATGGVRVTFDSGAKWLLAESISNGTATSWHLLRSEDDGSTWQPVTLPDPEEQHLQRAGISVPQLQADGRGCIVIYAAPSGNPPRARPDPYVSTTGDGGMTWSPWQLIKHNGYVQLLGANDWWATDGDVLYRSTDLGVTWSSIRPQLPAHMHLDLLFRATEQVAWNVYGNYNGTPVGQGIDRPHLLKTADGGRHWSEVKFPGL